MSEAKPDAALAAAPPVARSSAGTPFAVRFLHFLIAVLFLALVYTGIVLTFSNANFVLMDYDFASTLHDVTGIAISVLYIVFILYAWATGYWRVYKRRFESLGERMARPFARLMATRNAEAPGVSSGERRFEASTQFLLQLQLLAYLLALVILMPFLIITGLLYLFPETQPTTVLGLAGLWPLASAHYIAGLIGTLFLLIHVYISTIAGFRRIIFGR